MVPRLFLVLAALGIGDAAAQDHIAPYAAASLGIGDVAMLFTHTTANSINVLASGAVGIRLSEHLAIDAGIRTSLGLEGASPFRALSLGPVLRLGDRAFVRGGLGRIRGSDEIICVGSGPSCPRRYVHEWKHGFEVSAGIDLRHRRAWAIGPVAWWAQSTGDGVRYRSIGLGAQIRFH